MRGLLAPREVAPRPGEQLAPTRRRIREETTTRSGRSGEPSPRSCDHVMSLRRSTLSVSRWKQTRAWPL